ncbi:MptD family putative ECF transporter S component [Treponema lecithinolyticum]
MEQTQLQSGGKNRLVLKDLVNIAIFSVIYFVGLFVIGTPLGFLVVTYLAFPFAVSVVLGIAVMFLLAKVQKPFGLFIFAALPGCLMTLMGHTPVVAIHSLIVAAFAELVRKACGYKTVKGSIVGYALMSLWLCGAFWQIYIFTDQYRALTEKMMGAAYAQQLVSLPIWIMPILYVTAFAGGILGGLLGAKVLKKHFIKAGLV